jgi:7-cyano-7-deazaguanine synthase
MNLAQALPMTAKSPFPLVGLLLSGGLDSSILLAHLLRQGYRVQPFYIRAQLVWEREEFQAACRYLEAVACPALQTLVVLDLPLGDLYRDHWSITGHGVPDAASDDDAVYLPGRNALLTIKAALWCQMHRIETLMLGVLGSSPFADATPAFFGDLEAALNRGSARSVRLVRPLAELDKRQVLQLARDLPLELTFSCISPLGGLHCGRCNKCRERAAAFRRIGAEDPTHYAASADVVS